jgi:hypothetical protein
MKAIDREEQRQKEETMIAPGSIGDRALFASMLGSLSALAMCGHRWVLRETVTSERIRSHPLTVPRTAPNRVAT